MTPASSLLRLVAALAVAVLVGSTVAGTAAGAEGGPGSVLFGAYAQPRHGQSLQQAMQSLEESLGSRLPIVRSFGRFDSPLDSGFNRWAVDGGRIVLTSVASHRRDGSSVAWRDIANARPGTRLYDEMVALARSATRLDGEMWLIFSHEPEASFNRGLGSSDDFVDAWRALHRVFDAEGAGHVRWVWTMTSWSYEVEDYDPNDRRRAELWYPGDAYVDLLGADPYNWANCRGGTNDRWEPLADTITPFLEWSRRHPDKGLVLPEFGSVEGPPGAKAAWLRDASELMKRPEWGERFEAIVYFHDDHDDTQSGTDCRWWLDSSRSSLEAARAIATDPYFGAGSAPDRSPAPASTPISETPVVPKSELGAISPQVPECGGEPATIVGTDGADVLMGTPGRDVIVGLGGRDRINGRGGSDLICGGPGNDVLVGGEGADRMLGQDGRDVLRGGEADDVLSGGRQRDRLIGGSGDDRLLGGAGGDVVTGNGGNDSISGGLGNDRLYGNGGADAVTGGGGTDRCTGGPDRDRVHESCEVDI